MYTCSRSAFAYLLAVSSLSVLASGAAGCDTENLSEFDATTNAVEGNERILAEIDVDYGVIRFHELLAPDGTRSLAVSEMAPTTMTRTPLESLLNQGHFTALEVFKAVAPDLQVPPAIASAHPYETVALGRTDDSVVQARFDTSVPVQKSVASCESFVYQDPGTEGDWIHKQGKTNLWGSWWLYVAIAPGDTSYATASDVTLGVCNDSDVAISGRIAHDDTTDSTGWIYWGIATVNPGSSWRWWNFSKTSVILDPNCPPQNLFCYTMAPIRYGVWGNSPPGKAFHLRTAEEGPQQCNTSADCDSNDICLNGICAPNQH